jgi:hypothetical protein
MQLEAGASVAVQQKPDIHGIPLACRESDITFKRLNPDKAQNRYL